MSRLQPVSLDCLYFFIILDTSDALHDVTGQANECETGGRNQYNEA